MIMKKGQLVLRDVVFMMMIVSAIFVLAGFYVGEMAVNYENTNMSEEWAATGTSVNSTEMFEDVGEDMNTTASGLGSQSTGIWSLIDGAGNVLKGLGDALFMVLTAPNTIGGLIYLTLIDIGTGPTIAGIIKYLIITILWGVIVFTISSAFLRGGKL